jgi:hypothetical protein
MKMRRHDWTFQLGICGIAIACAAVLILGFIVQNRIQVMRTGPITEQVVLLGSNGVYSARRATLPWYMRSGQWQADIRSLAAAWRYITDADLVAQTNGTPLRAGDA